MKDVVLVITFWERKIYLERILDYYNSFEKDALPYIVIVDQSQKTWEKLPNASSIDEWFHLPNINFYEMQKFVIDHTKKKYFFLLSDDDFAIPSSLKIAAEYLNNNDDYVCATGQIVQLKRKRNFTSLYGFEFWTKKGLDNNQKENRVKSLFNNPKEITHTLFRSETMIIALNIVLKSIEGKNSLAPIKYWGKILMIVSAIEGKIKNDLACVSLVRTHRDLSKSGIDPNHFKNYPKVLERHLDVCSIKDRILFTNPLSEYVVKHFKIDVNSVSQFIFQVFNSRSRYSFFDKLKFTFPSYKYSEKKEIRKIKKYIY